MSFPPEATHNNLLLKNEIICIYNIYVNKSGGTHC